MSGTGMDGVVMNWVCAWLFSNLGHHAFKRYHQGIASSWPGVLRPSSAWCGPRLTSSWWSLGENLQTADLLGIEILNSCATFWVPTFRERKCDVWQLVFNWYTKPSWMSQAYILTFLGCIAFGVRQLRIFQKVDMQNSTHKDCSGCGKGSGGFLLRCFI